MMLKSVQGRSILVRYQEEYTMRPFPYSVHLAIIAIILYRRQKTIFC